MVFVTPGDELAGLHHVRYDGVPLLDRPDDVLGRLMQELDGGDEVEVLGGAEIWTHVRTPNNLVGWVPSMTLVAVSAAPAEDVPDHLSRSTSIPPPTRKNRSRWRRCSKQSRHNRWRCGCAACRRSRPDATSPAGANTKDGGAADTDAGDAEERRRSPAEEP